MASPSKAQCRSRRKAREKCREKCLRKEEGKENLAEKAEEVQQLQEELVELICYYFQQQILPTSGEWAWLSSFPDLRSNSAGSEAVIHKCNGFLTCLLPKKVIAL